MVADVENQKTPLVEHVEMQHIDEKLLQQQLDRDNSTGLQQLVDQWGLNSVLRPDPSICSTSLHDAARDGRDKCLKVLLESRPSKEDLEAPNRDGETALLVAVANGRPQAVRILLSKQASINARGDNYRTALHTLVLEVSGNNRTEEEQRRFLDVADLLLSPPYLNQIDLEPRANLVTLIAATPLAVAATKLPEGDGQQGSSGLVALCKKLVLAGASLSAGAKGGTVEEVLTRKGVLTADLRQERRQPPTRPIAAQVVDVISNGGSADKVEALLRGKSIEEKKEVTNFRLGTHSLLFRAVESSDVAMVRVLMDNKANPWVKEDVDELSLHRAAALGHKDIFETLVEKMKGNDNRLDLQEHTTSLIKKLMKNFRNKSDSSDINHMACFQRLLQEDVRLNLNQEFNGQTSLHVAASFNNQEAVSEILRSGAFLGASQPALGKDINNTLDYVLPATLERAMDGCITRHCKDGTDEAEDVFNENYTLHLDYQFLIPPQSEDTKRQSESVNEMKTLMEVCRSRRHRQAIKHPLMQTLLYAKWRKAFPLYALNVIVYLFFVVVLTAFVYKLKDLRLLEARVHKLHLNGTSDANLEADVENHRSTVQLLMGLLLPTWLFMVVREVFQIVFTRELYVKSIENFLEWILIMVVVVLCVTTLSTDTTRHVAAWAMIVAWYEFVLVLGRPPPLAIYITMLRHVSWNFFRIILLFSALILAFTISFNIILQPSGDDEGSDFSNFWNTLPKAIVMSTGEFEYSELSKSYPKTSPMSLTSSVLVFLVFLFLIFLVLMNVMNGLAVTDTQQVVDDAKLYSLTSRLELVYLVEVLFQYCPFLRCRVRYIQLLSGANHSPSLLAKINHPKKSVRLLSGKLHQFKSKLDGDTTECLRAHRLRYLEERELKERDDAMTKFQTAVQDLATSHPQVLQNLAATLRPEQ